MTHRHLRGIATGLNYRNQRIWTPKRVGTSPLPIETFYHFDGNDPSTMYAGKETWPTLPPTIDGNDGDVVQSWGLRTPNHKRFAWNGNVNEAPVYKTAIQNGLGVVRFDGINDYFYMGAGGGLDWNTDNFSIFAVMRWRSDATWQGFMSLALNNDFSDGWYMSENNPSTGGLGCRYLVQHPLMSTADLLNTFALIEWHVDPSNSVTQLWVNNVQVDSEIYSPTNLSTNKIIMGARWYSSAAQNIAALDVGEVLMYPSVLDIGDRPQIRDYLNDKWAVY